MVGAEGGISPEELDFAQKHGFVPVHFATNILRCETAALYGIAALQNAVVEKKVWQFKK
jgi:16S rRNA (uracil1498-N3)-methyltransferase